MRKLKYACLFSGIGAPLQGAYRVYGKENIEHIFSCEWDKFARQSFEANYDIEPEHFHKDVNDLDGTVYRGEVDILIGGSPCQAFSIAGLRNGTDDERGQLIYQYIRVVDEVRAPVIVYENVKGMMSIGGGRTIKEFVQALREIGYYCHYEVVNTKDYGVPQNRERIFLVGFLNHDHYHRFEMAAKVPLTKRLKDVLEDDVDEKYYLSDKAIVGLENHSEKHKAKGNGFGATVTEGDGTSNFLSARYYKDGSECLIKVPSATKSGYEVATTGDSINLSVPNSKTRRGRVGKQVAQTLDTQCNQAVVLNTGPHSKSPKIGAIRGRNPKNPKSRSAGLETVQMLEVKDDETSNCLTTVFKDNVVVTDRIRKLTPRECLRLQDFPDTFIQVCSDSQQYKQAGNSMSVNILEMIFRQIKKAQSDEPTNTLLDFC